MFTHVPRPLTNMANSANYMQDWVHNYYMCCINIPKSMKPAGLLQAFALSFRWWERVSVGFTMDLSVCNWRDYIITVVGGLIKRAHSIATHKSATEATVSHLSVKKIICFNHALHATNDSHKYCIFTSSCRQTLWRWCDTNWVWVQHTTHMHTELLNDWTEFLKKTSTFVCYYQQHDWYKFLCSVYNVCNNAKRSSTEFHFISYRSRTTVCGPNAYVCICCTNRFITPIYFKLGWRFSWKPRYVFEFGKVYQSRLQIRLKEGDVVSHRKFDFKGGDYGWLSATRGLDLRRIKYPF